MNAKLKRHIIQKVNLMVTERTFVNSNLYRVAHYAILTSLGNNNNVKRTYQSLAKSLSKQEKVKVNNIFHPDQYITTVKVKVLSVEQYSRYKVLVRYEFIEVDTIERYLRQ